MKKILFVCLLLFVSNLTVFSQPNYEEQPWKTHGRLIVSKNDPHFLSYEDGTPFFWLGDTGWELIHLLNQDEIKYYYRIRKQQGFNVIQTVGLSEFEGLTKPNAYGALPFINKDPSHLSITPGKDLNRQNEYDYWDHLDFVIDEAERQGMYVALLPCWGEYVIPREGNNIFKTEAQTYSYGNFLGKRLSKKKNVIWVLGGDRLPDEVPEGIALWRAMAKGLADGTNGVDDINALTDYRSTLMTYHCSESSSRWFQHDAWLDFNMWGSYHDNFSNAKAFQQVYADDSLTTIKPTLNGEPSYEEHPVNWLQNNGVFLAYDVRQMAYWSVFAGAFGHTYGCNPVWQFFDSARNFNYFAHTQWKKALFDEGAVEMIHLKHLIESRPMMDRVPGNDVIVKGMGTGMDRCIATSGKQFVLIYMPTGRPVTVQVKKIAARSVKAWWYNPRTGEATLIGVFSSSYSHEFSPPGISKELDWLKTGRGCDWVLVLDDLTAGFGQPGL